MNFRTSVFMSVLLSALIFSCKSQQSSNTSVAKAVNTQSTSTATIASQNPNVVVPTISPTDVNSVIVVSNPTSTGVQTSSETNTQVVSQVTNTSTDTKVKTPNAGAIAGGTIGGVAAVTIAGFIAYAFLKRGGSDVSVHSADEAGHVLEIEPKIPVKPTSPKGVKTQKTTLKSSVVSPDEVSQLSNKIPKGKANVVTGPGVKPAFQNEKNKGTVLSDVFISDGDELVTVIFNGEEFKLITNTTGNKMTSYFDFHGNLPSISGSEILVGDGLKDFLKMDLSKLGTYHSTVPFYVLMNKNSDNVMPQVKEAIKKGTSLTDVPITFVLDHPNGLLVDYKIVGLQGDLVVVKGIPRK